jgi:hypothetical protein
LWLLCGGLCRFAGAACDVPLFTSVSRLDPCVDGVVDLAGTCCRGFTDARTGRCCPGDSVTDKDGVCCDSPLGVDACGVCGGHGVAVDILGTCCSTLLPPSGVCCQSPAEVDSCGVCGGVNQCPARVAIVVTVARDPATGSPALPSAQSAAANQVATLAGLPSSSLWSVALVPLTNGSVSTTIRGGYAP